MGSEAAGLRTERLFGLDFLADATVGALTERLLAEVEDHRPGWRCVVTPNVDHLVRYDRLPADAAVARSAFLVLPDGMPIVWASKLVRRPLARRLTGSDLFATLWPALCREAVPTVVLAPSELVAQPLAKEHPTVRCVVPPVFDVDDASAVAGVVDDITAAVDDVGARFVFIAVSVAKTHVLATALRGRWSADTRPAPIVLLIGASPEFYLGLVRRAPRWIQRWGLEWLYRLAKEPRRLARRYLIDDPHFARLVWRELRHPS